jgi:hypothetical protein
VGALNQLTAHCNTSDGEGVPFHSIPSLFVFVRDCTKSFNESNFNVSKALLELFTAIFGLHQRLIKAPEPYLYFPATKLAVEKVGDKKLTEACSSCLHSICIVKDPQKVVCVAVKALSRVKSPLVHESLLCWFNKFCLDFGSASLSKGLQNCLIWVLKVRSLCLLILSSLLEVASINESQECESNNIKVREAALGVIGEMNFQLGPVLHPIIKAKTIEPSIVKLLDKTLFDHPYDAKGNAVKRPLKCITMSSLNGVSSQSAVSSILSLPKTDLVASLRSDTLSRLNSTEGKTAWKIRRDAMEEIRATVEKCSALIETEGNAFLSLKQLFSALRSRLHDSQSNLKPAAASLIGMLLNRVDDESQAKLGNIVFAALIHAAANDVKKTMREAAMSALAMGTESSAQNNGGANLVATECFVICLETTMTEATLKSSGLPDVISFLANKLETLYPLEESGNRRTFSVSRHLAKVIVLGLLSSKSGTRSAVETLLSKCTSSGILPAEDFDKEIEQLLPAQQRTVRSVIPKLSKEEQPARLSSSSRLPTMQARAKRNQSNIASSSRTIPVSKEHDESNPLHRGTANSSKKQRLLLLFKGDNWPEYPEEPSDVALQSVCKSWSQLISHSSIQLLFPREGFRSHEDAISGCDLIFTAIQYSRSNNDTAFLEELDLIFKWSVCALNARDHTSGLRSVISMLQLLIERLHELTYVMTDSEAIILLPTIFDKVGNAKPPFKDQLIDILSFIRLKELYQCQRYSSIVCMKVLEKSNSSRARSLAANECRSCVQAAGTIAIGKKGVETLARALSTEKLLEVRTSYLDLFYSIVQKSSLEKVLNLCNGDTVTSKTKGMIIDRCSKRPSTTPAPDDTNVAHCGDQRQSRLLSPSRKSVTSASNQVTSSSVVTGALKLRLQRLNVEKRMTGEPIPDPIPSTSAFEGIDVYAGALNEIAGMMNGEGTIEQGLQAIRRLGSATKAERSISDINRFVEIFAGALKFAFEGAILHSPLIQETVDSLTHVFRTPQYYSGVSQDSLECCIREAVHALLDDRLDAAKGANSDGIDIIIKGINKVRWINCIST